MSSYQSFRFDGDTQITDDSQLAREEYSERNVAMADIVVTCSGCNKTYRLGVDAAVMTSEAVATDFGATGVRGGSKEDPDFVAPYALGRSPSPDTLREVEKLSRVKAGGMSRYWKCNPCGVVNPYPWTH
jgi:hypothetical protein